MYYNNNFDQSNFPKALSKEELKDCFVKYKKGDLDARRKAIEHNIRLVIYRVNKRFTNFPFDPEEMFAYGLIGLIKSVDSFDIDKNNQFATYATRCIDNEILMYARKESKYISELNLEDILAKDEDGNEMKYEGVLEDRNVTFVEDYENQEEYNVLLHLVEKLNEKDKEMLLSFIGICGRKRRTQKEIADELGISQSYVSRKLNRIIDKLRNLYELHCNEHEEIQMKPPVEISKKRDNSADLKKNKTVEKVQKKHEIKKEKLEEVDTSKMLGDPRFLDIIDLLDEKSRSIVLLNLGSGFERSFTAEEIAQFLGIETAEVTGITKNVFIEYKKCLTKEKEDTISKDQKINIKVNLEV